MIVKLSRAFLCLSLISSAVYASDLVVLKSSSVPKHMRADVQKFVDEVNSHIPEEIKSKFNYQVKLEFQTYKDNKGLKALPANRCQSKANIKYAHVSTFNKKKINMTSLFLPEIIKGEAGSQQFPCGHKNYYKKAVATVLHEVGHLYDFKRIRSKKHKRNVKECLVSHGESSQEKFRNTSKCRIVEREERNKKTISGLHSFYKLSNWSRGFFTKNAKNLSVKRSIDAYEYKNLEEHYAVNLEYFLLDKEYKCRRPSYYKFFNKKLKHTPFPNYECEVYSEIVLDDKNIIRDINPDRVYRIDYLLASKGDGIMSGFGHSMYRIVLCAPHRKVVDENCLKDKLHHVVLSYRANVTDIKIDSIKGLLGGYDSVLFMLSFPNVIQEYNLGELRDLISQPIDFTPEQKKDFINKVLEIYWEYEGDYKFITNNCATESHELLQAALNEHEIIYDSVLKPYSVYDEIVENDLSKESYFEDMKEAVAKGRFFSSDRERLKDVKKNLFGLEESDYKKIPKHHNPKRNGPRKFKKKFRDIKEIYEDFDSSRLADKFEELKDLPRNKETKKMIDDLAIMTKAILQIRQFNIDEEVGEYLERNMEEETEIGKRIKRWNEMRSSSRIKPLDGGYGIPAKLTNDDVDKHNEHFSELKEIERELIADVKSHYQTEVDELLELNNLLKDIRKTARLISIDTYFKN
ncbi:DUF4105 domain-containing protein [Bacteriovorax sp. DB6_IX]|uniref:DUF7844 domain-containing protein n=1 Tax=Bacteriovorax sp. DB6_IX TaxID=1353530 RepID=UPI000558DC4C|nr:DUF4105 domain-containing protein [Bacteriovorax sp. DB6_IX]